MHPTRGHVCGHRVSTPKGAVPRLHRLHRLRPRGARARPHSLALTPRAVLRAMKSAVVLALALLPAVSSTVFFEERFSDDSWKERWSVAVSRPRVGSFRPTELCVAGSCPIGRMERWELGRTHRESGIRTRSACERGEGRAIPQPPTLPPSQEEAWGIATSSELRHHAISAKMNEPASTTVSRRWSRPQQTIFNHKGTTTRATNRWWSNSP
jgi:hypothetical protein